jgi:uncharacterized glyoxalase superfamily protein PhnB
VRDGRAALAFYERAFGAKTVHIVPGTDGEGVMHAHLIVNGSMIMLCDETQEHDTGVVAPATAGTTAVTFCLHLADRSAVDALFECAVAAGGRADRGAGRHAVGRALCPRPGPSRPRLDHGRPGLKQERSAPPHSNRQIKPCLTRRLRSW